VSVLSTAGLDAGERRSAVRHLLAHPILTAARQPAELDLVRRHAQALQSLFSTQLGYALVVESSFARLVKAPLPHEAPVRPARRPSDGTPSTPGTYVHLALVCAALLAPGVGLQPPWQPRDLPRPLRTAVVGRDGTRVLLRAESALSVLGPLVHWAEATGVDLADLEVRRPSLEDVYLALTATISGGA
jgi:hypothetical protein